MSDNIVEELERIINSRRRARITNQGNFIFASVMILIERDGGDYRILFIKRTENKKDAFSGHMAFPGGKKKSNDKDLLATAIRETYEETGIDLTLKGSILGPLDDVNPTTPEVNHYIVTPFVSYLEHGAELNTCEDEVAEAMWIPISHLKDPGNCYERSVERDGKNMIEYVYKYRDYVIWGLTGRILKQYISLTGHLF